MRHIFRSRPTLTEATHRTTIFEIFFDLVLVLAPTPARRVHGGAAHALSTAQGLLVLLILMLSWGAYTWLGNQAYADRGLVRAGTVIAMAAIFVAAMVIPDAWQHGREVNAPLILAVASIVIRAVHLALYFYAAAEDRQLRARLPVPVHRHPAEPRRRTDPATAVASAPLLACIVTATVPAALAGARHAQCCPG